MNNTQNNKQHYEAPTITAVEIDSCIALQLESAPPSGPDEAQNHRGEHGITDPYKTALV